MTDTLTEALAGAVERWPEKTFVRIDGLQVTYRAFEDQVGRLAAGLAKAGLQPGDRLLVVMTNSLACLHTWFAANRLGVLWAPVNTEFRGLSLAHAIKVADAQLAIVDDHLLEHVQAATQDLPRVIRTDELKAHYAETPIAAAKASFDTAQLAAVHLRHHRPLEGLRALAPLLHEPGRDPDPRRRPAPRRRPVLPVPALPRRRHRADDRPRAAARRHRRDLQALQRLAILGRDQGRRGDRLRLHGRDAGDPAQGARAPRDADNPIRVAWGVPLPEWAEDFERRFGLELVTMYGSVEANICVTQPVGTARVPGACGKATPEFEIQIQDEHGRELPPDTPGEVVIRPLQPR